MQDTPTRKAGHGPIGRGMTVLARTGYAAKGVVYVAIGGLSALAAFGSGSTDAAGSREALSRLGVGTLGTTLLAVVAVGIAAYVVWRLVQVFVDPEDRGTDAKGILVRCARFVSAVSYAGLGFWIVKRLVGTGSGGGATQGGGSSARSWSAELLQQPYGAWLLGALGALVVGVGVAEWVRAWRASFEKRLRRDLSGRARRTLRRIARAGLISRGVGFAIAGGFVIHAAATQDPSQARGLEGALSTLAQQSYGTWLMGTVALGLAAYGVFQMVKARYRRMGPAAG